MMKSSQRDKIEGLVQHLRLLEESGPFSHKQEEMLRKLKMTDIKRMIRKLRQGEEEEEHHE